MMMKLVITTSITIMTTQIILTTFCLITMMKGFLGIIDYQVNYSMIEMTRETKKKPDTQSRRIIWK